MTKTRNAINNDKPKKKKKTGIAQLLKINGN